MKRMHKTLILAAVCAGTLFVACSDDSDSVAGGAVEDFGLVANQDTVFIHDSVKVKVKVKDTVVVKDTVKTKMVVKDTVNTRDTVVVKDTVKAKVVVKDTVNTKDTVVVRDTVKDTVVVSKGVDISGFAQKGPFVKGSSVTLYEVDKTNNMQPTGRSISEVVKDDDGSFSFKEVSFASELVGISARGSFFDEVNGRSSFYAATLRGLTDLSDGRSTMNVNVMTSLEYDRVVTLMQENEDMTFAEAKKQAETEIFAFFGIDATGFALSEDLNIFGTTDGDAALLMVSVLLRSIGINDGLTSLIETMSRDFADNGTIDDEDLVDKLIFESQQVDHGRAAAIKSRLLDLDYVDEVPNFGKYLRQFWQKKNNLEDCTDENLGKVVFQENNNVYVCADSSDPDVGKAWRWATAIDYDTIGFGSNYKNGEVKMGGVNVDSVYVFDHGSFRRCIEWECSLLVGCVQEGATYKYDGEEDVYFKNYEFECTMTAKGLKWKVKK